MIAPARHVDIEGTHNTRDLGGLPLAAGGHTRAGRVWRSDGFGRVTAGGRDTLARHGVRTVIDLRLAGERLAGRHRLEGDRRFEVAPIDLFAPIVALARNATAAGDGKEPLDLATTYIASLRYAREGYRQVFDRIERAAAASAGPVVVHCTAGKDRTGLVAALLLRAAGVDDDAIADDYALTADRIGTIRQRLLEAAADKGIPAASYAPLLDWRCMAEAARGAERHPMIHLAKWLVLVLLALAAAAHASTPIPVLITQRDGTTVPFSLENAHYRDGHHARRCPTNSRPSWSSSTSTSQSPTCATPGWFRGGPSRRPGGGS